MSAPARPRPEWRTVDGILLLDKPAGLSSNQALQRVRRIFRARKAGHTGSLDPLATGVLPLCFGQATKVAGLLLDADKTYRATLALGARTATGDREGEVVERAPVPPLDAAAVGEALAGLVGPGQQVPPMYSALKRDGEPLYALARRGVEVERSARPVRIERLLLLGLRPAELDFEVTCSKGTYVRTLGEDIARALGSVGHLTALRRTSFGGAFAGATPHALAELEALAGETAALDALLLPTDAALAGLPAVTLGAGEASRFRHGQPVAALAGPGARVRLYAPGGAFLGLGESDAAGLLVRPLRMMTEAAAD
ncbi:MAG TPA: tRNA pseudouridine(55) synthase TruB [Steroidobacteraceae bacterium]|nr:tRNA pseudouridine(55) synthase TruB [Steroidobacteraceae bacterium]